MSNPLNKQLPMNFGSGENAAETSGGLIPTSSLIPIAPVTAKRDPKWGVLTLITGIISLVNIIMPRYSGLLPYLLPVIPALSLGLIALKRRSGEGLAKAGIVITLFTVLVLFS